VNPRGSQASAGTAGAQRGFLLLTAVVLIVVVALLLTVMVYFSATGSVATVRHLSSKQALFIAGTGLESGTRLLISPDLARVTCAAITGHASMTNIAFGDGHFTVTGGTPFYPAAPTTLRLGITAADNTIPVNSLTGYAARGRVLIGGEAIDYSETETADDATCGGAGRAPCLVGAARGRDGTTAAIHAAGSPVGQYQCDLESEGDVPDAASARGLRVVNQGVQLQEGWAVGTGGTILRWAGGAAGNPVWAAAASPVTGDLEGIFMLSYADGWAVGLDGAGAAQSPRILYWNGTAWATRNSNLNINVDLFGIHCVDSDDCWAVGESGNNAARRPFILRWNGTAWATNNSNLDINVDLRDVYCVATNNCWAVGLDGAGAAQSPFILQWNGSFWGTNNSNLNINVDLFGIHCVAINNCWAVGESGNNAARRPFILQWNGTVWATNNSNLNINRDLADVYCVAFNDCWAVGEAGGVAAQRPLILHWNGTAWATSNSNLNIDRDLNDVYCVTSNDCWAVGLDGTGAAQSPLILHWNGTAWATGNSNLNINPDLMAVHVIGARQHPQAVWREIYQ
jgi:prepilin-type processing-associated H-X9-DG protein